jgi:hypothetical protein
VRRWRRVSGAYSEGHRNNVLYRRFHLSMFDKTRRCGSEKDQRTRREHLSRFDAAASPREGSLGEPTSAP